ncbi:MAG: NYN domain-containing protein [Streptosporangiales bacterium]|nr:NYN domain-containing protein [Streptosporangiales bacterium]
MDRCALFVDAGYLLADGAMAVHGTRHRDAVSWDYSGLLELLGRLARDRTGLPLLRCYWYEATVEGRRTAEHDALADLPNLKLRLGRIRPGRREGVDALVYRDLTMLARRSALCDAVVVSGDEDLVQAVADAQDFGVRVTVVHVTVDGNWTIARTLRQECDDLIEVGASHLRPYVNLLTGVDTSSPPLSNGQATSTGFPSPTMAPPPSPHSGPHFASGHPSGPHPLSAPTPGHGPISSAGSGPMHPSSSGPMHAGPSGPMVTGPSSGPSYVPSQRDTYAPGPNLPAPVPSSSPTLNDAVKAAHQEGRDFGETVARDAPALWLEAVLARKPRMPSDLEARLLQGSSLPIDFLLHDEVRHALRRGFWDALEQSRRP